MLMFVFYVGTLIKLMKKYLCAFLKLHFFNMSCDNDK